MVSPPLHGPGWAARFPVLLLGFMGGEDKSGPRPMTAQRRLALGFAIAVELRAGLGDFRLIAQRPGAERRDRLQQVAAERRERIIDARRDGRKHRARHQTVALEPAQRQGQHALRDAADRAPQLVEAQRAVAKPADHQNRPFVADPGQDVADGAAIGGQILVPRFHRCALLCLFLVVTYLALVTHSHRGIQPCPSPRSPSSSDRTARNRSTASLPKRSQSSARRDLIRTLYGSTICRCSTRTMKRIFPRKWPASRTRSRKPTAC